MTWKTDKRTEQIRDFGPMSVQSQTDSNGDTAHLIVFTGGAAIRVLPDGESSGQRRARVVRSVCEATAALRGVPVDVIETYVVGGLARADLKWEDVGDADEQTIEDWLGHWFLSIGEHACAEALLTDLEADGWEIRRAE